MRIEHDWYLSAWLGKERGAQTRLAKRAGWDKRKASHLLSGKQAYDRDSLNQAAAALHIAPFELLMPPDEAMAMRRMRQTALQIAAEPAREYDATIPDIDALVADAKRRKR